jgi:hypothetical protein
LLFFPPYLPPSTFGVFEVVFSNTAFGGVEDSVKRRFRVTEKAWATDNLEILPEGIPVEWDISLFHFQPGAVYRTGSVMDTARQIFFGLKNANQIFNPAHPEYNIISGVIYDADYDSDGEVDFESPDSLLAIPIVCWNEPTKALVLKPRHWYYVSFIYDGPDVAKFFITPKEYYFNFPSSPAQIGSVVVGEGFEDLTVVQRLGNEKFSNPSAAPNLLSPSKFTLSPNPANNFFQLDLRLSAANKKIVVSLFDWQGRAMASAQKPDFQEGVISFEVKNLPSGVYLLWIRTDEGSTMRQVMICH